MFREKSPDLSVIIPTIGRWPQLKRTILSVRKIPSISLEVVVVVDGTPIPAPMKEWFSRRNIRFDFLIKRGGPAAARNQGVRISHGKRILFVDDDDWIFPHGISRLYLLASQEESLLAYGDSVYLRLGKFSAVLGKTEYRVNRSAEFSWPVLLSRNLAPIGCYLFHRSLWDRIGNLDEQIWGGEDWDFVLRAARVSEPKHYPILVYHYYLGQSDSITSNREEDFRKGLGRIMAKHRTLMQKHIDPKTLDRMEKKVQGLLPILGLPRKRVPREKVMHDLS